MPKLAKTKIQWAVFFAWAISFGCFYFINPFNSTYFLSFVTLPAGYFGGCSWSLAKWIQRIELSLLIFHHQASKDKKYGMFIGLFDFLSVFINKKKASIKLGAFCCSSN